jgi:excinuclease UvrABC nuclease subunit
MKMRHYHSLIVIDGGKGQLHAAMESMKALNLEN